MTTSTLPFLGGRTSADNHRIREAGRFAQRSSGVRKRFLRRLRRAEAATVQHDHHAREESDAYLDRTGLSSVDWMDALGHHAQR